jgi:hypothetical protein
MRQHAELLVYLAGVAVLGVVLGLYPVRTLPGIGSVVVYLLCLRAAGRGLHRRLSGVAARSDAVSYSRRYRATAVAIGFAVFIAISLAVAFLASSASSPKQSCMTKCSAFGKQGHLVYSGPATPKQQYKEAHSECQCE